MGGGRLSAGPRPDRLAEHLRRPGPPILGLLERHGVAEDELRRTFNLGIGMVLVVPDAASDEVAARADASCHGFSTFL